jgi:hypothetical protein
MEEVSTHECVQYYRDVSEKLNFIHCLFQEMEELRISLPMGDYTLVYDIIEDIRDDYELQKLFSGNF